jgi:hypothetical protein
MKLSLPRLDSFEVAGRKLKVSDDFVQLKLQLIVLG